MASVGTSGLSDASCTISAPAASPRFACISQLMIFLCLKLATATFGMA